MTRGAEDFGATDDGRIATPYPTDFLSTGMRLRNFAEAFALRDEGALEKAGEDAAGRAEQPKDKKSRGVCG